MNWAVRLGGALAVLFPAGVAQADDVDGLIGELRSDEAKWNAIRAAEQIERLPTPPLHELHEALNSTDWQQRQMACQLLWGFLEPPEWIVKHVLSGEAQLWRAEPRGTVTRRLLEVTFEGLRSDALPWDQESGRYTGVFNAASGFRAMSRHAHEARELLERGLESDDEQQRLVCAMALGRGGVRESAEAAAEVLLPHLRDNDIEEDAKWCVWALYGFGDAVVPALKRALPGSDEQQRELILLLLLDIERPPMSRDDLERRKTLNRVAQSVFDPAIEGPLDDTMSWLGQLTPRREVEKLEEE